MLYLFLLYTFIYLFTKVFKSIKIITLNMQVTDLAKTTLPIMHCGCVSEAQT